MLHNKCYRVVTWRCGPRYVSKAVADTMAIVKKLQGQAHVLPTYLASFDGPSAEADTVMESAIDAFNEDIKLIKWKLATMTTVVQKLAMHPL